MEPSGHSFAIGCGFGLKSWETAVFVITVFEKYLEYELPTIRTISTKLNNLNFHPQKVAKTKPAKKIKKLTNFEIKKIIKFSLKLNYCTPVYPLPKHHPVHLTSVEAF